MSFDFFVGPVDEPDKIRLGAAVASGSEGVLYTGALAVGSGELNLAVKMLQPGHLGHLEEWRARWAGPVELLKRVKIPGLVTVSDSFVGPLPHPRDHADGSTASLYLLMDWVEGVSLDRWARSIETVEPEQLLLSLVPVAAALDLLHSGAASNGVPIVHRDVKPANILIRPKGDTVLVDVGSIRDLSGDSRRSGVVGTPGYIAPEVRADATYGPAADRYALGAVAFFLLTGSEPPVAASVHELQGLLRAAPLLQDRPEVADHVLTMLDPVAERRPTSLSNWVAQLRHSSLAMLPGEVVLPPRAPSRHPQTSGPRELAASRPGSARTWVLAAAVSVALAAFAALFVVGPSSAHRIAAKGVHAHLRSSPVVIDTPTATTDPTIASPRPATASAGPTSTTSGRRSQGPSVTSGPRPSGQTTPTSRTPALKNYYPTTVTCSDGYEAASAANCPVTTTTVRATPSRSTFTETAGGAANTWTNYVSAGGTAGPIVPANVPIQIACRITGFQVADGNTWWYRIASSPWNNVYYVSADAFYNDGETSGSLISTPFYDPAVPPC